MSEFKTLFIKDLKIDQKFQARSRINLQVVKEYEESIIDGASMPPIMVVQTPDEYVIVDGFHRLQAYRNLGRDRIEAEVITGDLDAALRNAISANQTHGLQRSREDKLRAVTMALEDFELSCDSDRVLGKLCGVSHTFVASVREQLGKEKSKSKFSRKAGNVTRQEVESTPPSELADDPSFKPDLELIDMLTTENDRLKDRIALVSMDGSAEDRSAAEKVISELREELRTAKIELEAIRSSRDRYQSENAQLIRQCQSYQNKIKRMNEQLVNRGQQ
jgi:FtsZ-binding cell division protein ZapB